MRPSKKIDVYITNDYGYDLSDAYNFTKGEGKLIPITEGKVSIQHVEKLTNKMMFILKEMTEDDYLLISGNSIIASLASALVFNKFKKLKMLIFDAREHKYLERSISLEKMGNMNLHRGNFK